MRNTSKGEECSAARNHHKGAELETTIARQAHFSLGSSLTSRENVRDRSSGSPVVAMMQSTEPGHHNDFAPGLRVTHRNANGRSFLRQSEMRPVLVVVADVLIHQALQMAFIENDHMVKQIAAAVANPVLSNVILPQTSITCPPGLDTKHFYCIDQPKYLPVVSEKGPICYR
jgi:hypothetical protein